jgi:cysteine desulfurase
MKKPIYFDHNATTPMRPEVLEAMLPYLKGHYGNPSSLYHLGQDARKAIDHAREQLAALIGVSNPEQILFTSGGSESINLAIKGTAAMHRKKTHHHMVTSKIEHSAGINSCKYLESKGWIVNYLGVDWHGRVDPAHVAEAITKDTALVSIMHANNEIGTIQPIAEIAAVCREKDVPLHVDAVQTVGKIPVHVDELGVTMLSLAAHKFYGPKGVGALFVRSGTRLEPLVHGGRHERNRRAGTENVASIVGLGAAAEWAMKQMKAEEKHVRHLRDRLEKGLSKMECVRLNGHPTERLFNTLNMSVECIDGEGMIIGLDMQGICVSSGSACSSGQTEVSHVLKAIGLPLELAKGSIRFSLGWDNTTEDVDKVLEVLPGIVARLRNISPLWDDYKKGLRPSVIGKEAA